MVHFILLISTLLVLVLVYYQWRIMQRQQLYIKTEAESLRLIREENGRFVPPGLFGLLPESPYLKQSDSKSGIQQKRVLLLSQHFRNKKKKKHFQPF